LAEVQLWPLLAVYNTGVSNPGGVMPIQQQQLGSQEAFGNMQPNAQNLQSSMAVTVYFPDKISCNKVYTVESL